MQVIFVTVPENRAKRARKAEEMSGIIISEGKT
jgi:hypothetical protein